MFLNTATLQFKKHSEYETLWQGSTNSTKIPPFKLDQKLSKWKTNNNYFRRNKIQYLCSKPHTVKVGGSETSFACQIVQYDLRLFNKLQNNSKICVNKITRLAGWFFVSSKFYNVNDGRILSYHLNMEIRTKQMFNKFVLN